MWDKLYGCDYRYGGEIHEVNPACICACKLDLCKIIAEGIVCAVKLELNNSFASCLLFSEQR